MQKLVKPFESIYIILRNCKRLSVHLDRNVIAPGNWSQYRNSEVVVLSRWSLNEVLLYILCLQISVLKLSFIRLYQGTIYLLIN